jgi:hypothetical protein
VQDLGVRVNLKRRFELLLELCDLVVEAGDQPHQRRGDGPVGTGHRWWRLELARAKGQLDLLGLRLDVLLAAALLQSTGDLLARQTPTQVRCRRDRQDGNGIHEGEAGAERFERLG